MTLQQFLLQPVFAWNLARLWPFWSQVIWESQFRPPIAWSDQLSASVWSSREKASIGASLEISPSHGWSRFQRLLWSAQVVWRHWRPFSRVFIRFQLLEVAITAHSWIFPTSPGQQLRFLLRPRQITNPIFQSCYYNVSVLVIIIISRFISVVHNKPYFLSLQATKFLDDCSN